MFCRPRNLTATPTGEEDFDMIFLQKCFWIFTLDHQILSAWSWNETEPQNRYHTITYLIADIESHG